MAIRLQANDNLELGKTSEPEQPGNRKNRQELHGKSLQINENSVEDRGSGKPAERARQGTAKKPNKDKLHGKSLRVNGNTVGDNSSDT